jgi:hypothetical protein
MCIVRPVFIKTHTQPHHAYLPPNHLFIRLFYGVFCKIVHFDETARANSTHCIADMIVLPLFVTCVAVVGAQLFGAPSMPGGRAAPPASLPMPPAPLPPLNAPTAPTAGNVLLEHSPCFAYCESTYVNLAVGYSNYAIGYSQPRVAGQMQAVHVTACIDD